MVNPMMLVKQVGKIIVSNSPTVLTGLAIGGIVTTTAMSIDATITSVTLVNEEKHLREKDAIIEGYTPEQIIPLTKLDIIKLIWKEYAPVATVGLATIFCIIGINKIHMRRNAALVGLYELADTSLREYRAKVIETIGEKKEMDIRDSIAQDLVNRSSSNNDNIIVTSCGNTLCLDPFSGRYFRSDVTKILKAQNDFNNRLLADMSRPLNEFYDEIGLEPVEAGNNLGWAWEYGMLEIRFTSALTKEKEPCLVLEYKNGPRAI